MRSAVLRLASLAPLVLLAACGGASASSGDAAKSARDAKQVPDISIGDAALAQGGLDTLGGGRNRSAADVATGGALHFDHLLREQPVKMDGELREWPARVAAKTALKGDSSRSAMAVSLQYDDARIYVGAEIADDAFMRTSLFKETEDHAVLTLAFPVGNGGALATYEVSLFAGEPGESAGTVRFTSGARRGQEVPGAKIVEAPDKGGYSFEASIPWGAFAEGRTTRVGLHGSVRYVDADSPTNVRAVLATSSGDAAHAASLPLIPTEPELALVEGLLSPKGLLGTSPKLDLIVDVAGDAMKERVAVYDHFLTIVGPHYRGGSEYFFRDLGADLVRLDARPITGRKVDDLVLARRYETEGTTREVFEVWSILKGSEEPQTTFAHEISVARGSQRVANAVHVGGRDIEVGYEPAAGWDVSTYKEPTSGDVEPIVLPWGAVKSQTFRFDGSKFVKAHEVAQQAATGFVATPGGPSARDSFSNTLAEARKQEPATPTVSKGGDLSADVLALYKKDHNVAPSTKARFDLAVNVGGGAENERVLLLGRDLVVFGPGFKGGTGYSSVTLSMFASDDDIHEVSARDLTGDGAADIVVRGARHVKASGQPAPVDVESLFVYQIDSGDSINRVFAIETSREQGRKRVQGLVQFVPADDHKSFEIDVRPGLARGWNARSYPWQQEQPGGQMEPLLLPWGGVQGLRYSWDGTKFSVKN
jgi:hypothetical protein